MKPGNAAGLPNPLCTGQLVGSNRSQVKLWEHIGLVQHYKAEPPPVLSSDVTAGKESYPVPQWAATNSHVL